MFCALPTARVISRHKQVWTYSVLGDQLYEMRCLIVAVGPNAHFVVLPHWNNMS